MQSLIATSGRGSLGDPLREADQLLTQTVLVPYKNPPDHAKYAYTASRYNRPFVLDAIADQIGYPMFMKPYDGGAWVGVSQLKSREDLHRAYDEFGQRLMHLQKAVSGFDVFARSLSIGAETMVMNFDSDQPMHARYSVNHNFLDAEVGDEVVTIGRLVNAFFRWEFPAVLRRGQPRRPVLPGEDRGLPAAGRRLLRDRAVRRLLRLPAGWPTSTRWSRTGWTRRSSTAEALTPDQLRRLPEVRLTTEG